MTAFYLAPAAEQSALMAFLFLALILSVFSVFAFLDKGAGKGKLMVNAGVSALLLLLILCLHEGVLGKETVKVNAFILVSAVPVWVLWCVGVLSTAGLLCQDILLPFGKKRSLGLGSIKQAMDTLPSGICYFTSSGSLKLCNLQMYRLFQALAQRDLQHFDELRQALASCDGESPVQRLPEENQTYLFPDGTAWRYSQTEVTLPDGTAFTQAVFSDVTELYEKGQKLKEQTRQLEAFSRDLKALSDNALTLARETEVLSAKTKLHDQMGAGITAMRQILLQEQAPPDAGESLRLFQKAVHALKSDSKFPLEHEELGEFLQDADTIGVKVTLTGELPMQEDASRLFLLALRESLTNSVRHAGATELTAAITCQKGGASLRITNNGASLRREITPKGGLLNLRRQVVNLGGSMEIGWSPKFTLTVTIPAEKEETP